jgi:hypothetical protein
MITVGNTQADIGATETLLSNASQRTIRQGAKLGCDGGLRKFVEREPFSPPELERQVEQFPLPARG